MATNTKYYTVVMRYATDSDDPCSPPPHILERIAMAASAMHADGFALDVIYGEMNASLFKQIEKEMN